MSSSPAQKAIFFATQARGRKLIEFGRSYRAAMAELRIGTDIPPFHSADSPDCHIPDCDLTQEKWGAYPILLSEFKESLSHLDPSIAIPLCHDIISRYRAIVEQGMECLVVNTTRYTRSLLLPSRN